MLRDIINNSSVCIPNWLAPQQILSVKWPCLNKSVEILLITSGYLTLVTWESRSQMKIIKKNGMHFDKQMQCDCRWCHSQWEKMFTYLLASFVVLYLLLWQCKWETEEIRYMFKYRMEESASVAQLFMSHSWTWMSNQLSIALLHSITFSFFTTSSQVKYYYKTLHDTIWLFLWNCYQWKKFLNAWEKYLLILLLLFFS